jgi:hypothetical protein
VTESPFVQDIFHSSNSSTTHKLKNGQQDDMILKGPLALNAVSLFRGIVDIYLSRGQIIARSWPRYRPKPPTDGQAKTQSYLTQTHTILKNETPEFHNLFSSNTIPTGRSREDIKRKLTLWALNQECYSPPPVILAWTQSTNPNGITSTLSLYYQSVSEFLSDAWTFKFTTCPLTGPQTWWITIGVKRARAGATETKITVTDKNYSSPNSVTSIPLHNKYEIQLNTINPVTSIIPYHI